MEADLLDSEFLIALAQLDDLGRCADHDLAGIFARQPLLLARLGEADAEPQGDQELVIIPTFCSADLAQLGQLLAEVLDGIAEWLPAVGGAGDPAEGGRTVAADEDRRMGLLQRPR